MAIKSLFHRHTLSLTAIVLLAMGLRLYRLEYQSLWVDEIASMNGADPDQSWSGVIAYSVFDQPPAFFLLLHAWFKAVPFTDFFGRLLALVLGLAGIVAVYFLGKEVKDKSTGLIAATITTFSYIHILFSQEARFYSLLFLASAMSYYFYIRAAKTSRVFDFILYALSTAVLLYTHYFGLVVFAAQGIIFCLILTFYPVSRKFVILSVSAAILVILAISPWIPIFFSDAQTKEFWIQHEPFYFPFVYFYVYFKDVFSCFAFAILLIIYFFNVYKHFVLTRRMDRNDFILIAGVAFSFLIPIIYSFIQTPMLQVRYTLIILPSLIVMISLGLRFLKISHQRILLVATCCTSLFSLIVIEKYYTKIRKEDWRGMISTVIKESTPGDAFVSPQAWYCNYYFKIQNSGASAIQPAQWMEINQKPEGLWWLDGFKVGPIPDDVKNKLIQSGYSLKKTDSLFRTRAYYYRLH